MFDCEYEVKLDPDKKHKEILKPIELVFDSQGWSEEELDGAIVSGKWINY